MTAAAALTTVITPEALLAHWQGHRRVTRRTIAAFPEDQLFSYSLAGMRPFSEFALEFLAMAEPIAEGVATGKWTSKYDDVKPTTKDEILKLWDAATEQLDAIFPTIPAHRYAEKDMAFGKYEMTGIDMILYAIENEVHHRGQGFVYLRSLGIEPPFFYDRS